MFVNSGGNFYRNFDMMGQGSPIAYIGRRQPQVGRGLFQSSANSYGQVGFGSFDRFGNFSPPRFGAFGQGFPGLDTLRSSLQRLIDLLGRLNLGQFPPYDGGLPPAPPPIVEPPAPGPFPPSPTPMPDQNPSGSVLPPNGAGVDLTKVDFTKLTPDQKTAINGLTSEEKAVMHLWGRQMIGRGHQDGGIYFTVMDSANGDTNAAIPATQTEINLVRQLQAEEMREFGGITGKALDRRFFELMRTKFGAQGLEERYGNAPIHFAQGAIKFPNNTHGLAVDSPEWQAALERQNGLSGFENAVLRLWGHNPLMSTTGSIDGAILPITLLNATPLDNGSTNRSAAETLLKADLGSDGVLNGDSLQGAFETMMDKLYLGAAGPTEQSVMRTAENRSISLGRTREQFQQSITQGVQDTLGGARTAMANLANTVKDHPVITTGVLTGGAIAMATCPFLAGGMAGLGALSVAAAGKNAQAQAA